MNLDQVEDKIRHFIAMTVLLGQDDGQNSETPLLEWGIINSMEMKRLMRHLHAEFGVSVSPEDVVADNFRSIRAIAVLVARLHERDPLAVANT
jgi:acyl carrier protein